jgi:hypothetical protein
MLYLIFRIVLNEKEGALKANLREMFGEDNYARLMMNGEFKPFGSYDYVMDRFTYLEANTSYRAKYSNTSNVILLLHPHEDRIIGVHIQGFAVVAKLGLIEAVAKKMPWYLRVQFRLYCKWLDRKTIWRFRWHEFKQRFQKQAT